MKFHLILIITISFSLYPQNEDRKYFFVFLNTNPDREELSEDKLKEIQEGHMNNINRLAEEDKLIIAGPVKGGGGIFVLNASSLEEVSDYLQTDPAIKAKRFNTEVYPMIILEGNICKPDKDFTMVNYTFIRYEDNIFINDEGLVLAKIEFDGNAGSIIILNYDLEKGDKNKLNELIKADNLIYTKTLWIAKGSFCE